MPQNVYGPQQYHGSGLLAEKGMNCLADQAHRAQPSPDAKKPVMQRDLTAHSPDVGGGPYGRSIMSSTFSSATSEMKSRSASGQGRKLLQDLLSNSGDSSSPPGVATPHQTSLRSPIAPVPLFEDEAASAARQRAKLSQEPEVAPELTQSLPEGTQPQAGGAGASAPVGMSQWARPGEWVSGGGVEFWGDSCGTGGMQAWPATTASARQPPPPHPRRDSQSGAPPPLQTGLQHQEYRREKGGWPQALSAWQGTLVGLVGGRAEPAGGQPTPRTSGGLHFPWAPAGAGQAGGAPDAQGMEGREAPGGFARLPGLQWQAGLAGLVKPLANLNVKPPWAMLPPDVTDRRGRGALGDYLSGSWAPAVPPLVESSGVGYEARRGGQVRGRLAAELLGTAQVGKGLEGHTVYRIGVRDRESGEQWEVRRRYRLFKELHSQLEPSLALRGDYNAFQLPPKEVWGGRNGGVVERRLRALALYLNQLLSCGSEISEDPWLQSFLEVHPWQRGIAAFGRRYGSEAVAVEGWVRLKAWKGPPKPVVNSLETGLGVAGWSRCYMVVCRGPVVYAFSDPEHNPDKPLWSMPDRRILGAQLRVQRVELWGSAPGRSSARFFALRWEERTMLCQVEGEEALERWMRAIDPNADTRPQLTDEDRKRASVELKAKEAFHSREEDLWGGL